MFPGKDQVKVELSSGAWYSSNSMGLCLAQPHVHIVGDNTPEAPHDSERLSLCCALYEIQRQSLKEKFRPNSKECYICYH